MSETTVPIGTVFVMRLEGGGVMPLQVVDQKAGGTLSICALLGRRYPEPAAVRAAAPAWTPSDVVAEVTIPTINLEKQHDPIVGALGKLPILQAKPAPGFRLRMADAIRSKLGIRDQGLRHCSIWVMYDVGNACLGLKAWDSMAKPEFFEQFLTDPANPLVTRRYEKPRP